MFGFGKKSGPEAGEFKQAMSPEEAEALAQEIEDMETIDTLDDGDPEELDFDDEGMPKVA